MKNRFFAVFLAGIFLLAMTACQFGGTTELMLYYRQSEISYDGSGLIGSQTAWLSESVTPEAVAEIYFAAETEELLVSPFPKGTELIESEMEDRTLSLKLSENFGMLSGADLSLALACLTMTFSQLPDVEYVEVSIESGLLQNQQSIRLAVADVMIEGDGLSALDVVLTLYYADEENSCLVPVEFRTTAGTAEEQAKLVVAQLGVEPEDKTLHTVLPKKTEILDLSIEDGLCIVDFSSDFYRNRPENESEARLMIYAIVNTLTEFEEVTEVQILIEGELQTEYSTMDLSSNFVRDESMIGSR